jgi:hypothetical protein
MLLNKLAFIFIKEFEAKKKTVSSFGECFDY